MKQDSGCCCRQRVLTKLAIGRILPEVWKYSFILSRCWLREFIQCIKFHPETHFWCEHFMFAYYTLMKPSITLLWVSIFIILTEKILICVPFHSLIFKILPMFHLVNKYSLNVYQVQGMNLGPREINKTSLTLPLGGFIIYQTIKINKKYNKYHKEEAPNITDVINRRPVFRSSRLMYLKKWLLRVSQADQ